jgi:hypothetical protein
MLNSNLFPAPRKTASLYGDVKVIEHAESAAKAEFFIAAKAKAVR